MSKNERRCVSCLRVGPKDSFWRMVRLHPSWQIQLNRGMGRSAYLCPREDCLRQAQRKNRLGRALKATVGVHVYAMLHQKLTALGQLDQPTGDVSEPSGGPVDDKRKSTEQNQNL
ncbi:MAG: YlxR family protein [Gemmatimonadaceae bacterium]|nr:YlxR family protein [Gloeobacterales cyanobacterium ES-bin-141]